MSENGRFDLKNELVLYAEKFLDKSPTALGPGKLAINRSLDLDTPAGLDDAAMVQSLLLDSEEYLQAMRTFDQKRNK
jgi:enoyl-CoA hydratase/carnithine racemase